MRIESHRIYICPRDHGPWPSELWWPMTHKCKYVFLDICQYDIPDDSWPMAELYTFKMYWTRALSSPSLEWTDFPPRFIWTFCTEPCSVHGPVSFGNIYWSCLLRRKHLIGAHFKDLGFMLYYVWGAGMLGSCEKGAVRAYCISGRGRGTDCHWPASFRERSNWSLEYFVNCTSALLDQHEKKSDNISFSSHE